MITLAPFFQKMSGKRFQINVKTMKLILCSRLQLKTLAQKMNQENTLLKIRAETYSSSSTMVLLLIRWCRDMHNKRCRPTSNFVHFMRGRYAPIIAHKAHKVSRG